MGLRKREKASKCGVIAQLVEHLVRNEKVMGSNPLGSTILHPVFPVLAIVSSDRSVDILVPGP